VITIFLRENRFWLNTKAGAHILALPRR